MRTRFVKKQLKDRWRKKLEALQNRFLGGALFFLNLTPTWGNDPIRRAYFSDGLKPPTLMSNIDVYQNVQGTGIESSLECHKKIYGTIGASFVDLGLDSKKEEELPGFENDNHWKLKVQKIYSFPEKVIFIFPQNLVRSLIRMRLEGLLWGSGSLEKPTDFAKIYIEWLTSKKADDEYLFFSPFIFFQKIHPKHGQQFFSLSFFSHNLEHNSERFRW